VLSVRPSIKNSLNVIKNNDETIARWISHVISPHIVGVVLTSAMALEYSPNPLKALLWLFGIMPLLVLPPLGYMMWLVRRGKLADIYMPERETRLRPLTLMMVWLMICWGLIRYWGAPSMVELFVLMATVMIGVLSLVTLFWKISFHGAAITAAATVTVLVAGSSAWPVMLLVPLVGWARVRLERHTPRQVIFGSLVGALIAFILVYGAIFSVSD
jgi:membrane-associated phospholipid phosphatase